MDCRTPEEIKQGKMIVIFDLDDGCGPDKESYWNNDENIVVINPIEMTESGDVDFIASLDRLKALVSYVKTEFESGVLKDKVKAVVLDGFDTLKKWSMYKMKEGMGLKVTGDVKKDMKQQDWEIRNFAILNIIVPLKNMNCDRYFITHLKARKEYRQVGGNSQLTVVGYDPDWLEGTPGMMFQCVRCTRVPDPFDLLTESVDTGGKITLSMKLEKCKSDLSREGKEIILAEVDTNKGTSRWEGSALHKLIVE